MGLISGEGCPVPPSDQQISLLPSLLVDFAVGTALAMKPRKFRHSVPFCMQACNPYKLKILQECYHRRKGTSMDNSKSIKAAASIKRSQTDSKELVVSCPVVITKSQSSSGVIRYLLRGHGVHGGAHEAGLAVAGVRKRQGRARGRGLLPGRPRIVCRALHWVLLLPRP